MKVSFITHDQDGKETISTLIRKITSMTSFFESDMMAIGSLQESEAHYLYKLGGAVTSSCFPINKSDLDGIINHIEESGNRIVICIHPDGGVPCQKNLKKSTP